MCQFEEFWDLVARTATQLVAARWEFVLQRNEIQACIKFNAKKYRGGIESRVDIGDMEQEAYQFLWHACHVSDPLEAFPQFMAYIRKSIPNILNLLIRKHKVYKKHSVTSEVQGDVSYLDTPNDTDVENSIIAVDLLRKLELVVVSKRDPRLFAVYMTQIYPSQHLVSMERAHLAKINRASTANLPLHLRAKASGLSEAEYAVKHEELKRLVLDLLEDRLEVDLVPEAAPSFLNPPIPAELPPLEFTPIFIHMSLSQKIAHRAGSKLLYFAGFPESGVTWTDNLLSATSFPTSMDLERSFHKVEELEPDLAPFIIFE